MAEKPTYEELEQRVGILEDANLELSREIDQRKHAEEALRESEEKFRLISEQSLMAILIIQDNEIKYVNQAYAKMTGYSMKEIMSWTMADTARLIHPDDRDFVIDQGRKKAEGVVEGIVTHYSYRGTNRSGEIRWVDQYSKTITYGGKPADLITMIDIHDQEVAKESLRESDEHHRSFMESARGFIVYRLEVDPENYFNGRPVFVSSSIKDEIGISPEAEFSEWFKNVHPDDLPGLAEAQAKSIQNGITFDRRFRWKNIMGEWRWGHAVSNPVFDSEGKPKYFNGIIMDITAQMEAEEGLKESEEKYRTLVENLPVAVYQNTPGSKGKFFMVNPAFCKILGYNNEEEVKKVSVSDIYANPEERKQFSDTLMEKGVIEIDERNLLKRDGTPVYASVTASARYDRDGNVLHFDCIFLDISEQKNLERQLRQAQKMEAIGMLAGGVAHDLNNILSGLVSYPELLLLQLPDDNPLRSSILTIQKSGEKAAAVVQDLLTLARRGVVITQVVNPNDIISEYLKSPEYENFLSYHPGVHMESHLEKDVLNILGSPTHLSKTIMNLVSNAAEAMPEGGKLTLSTENRYIDKPIRGHDNVKEGDYVVLTVTDTGTGISTDDIDKIFEPFYTKKKMGRSGTGLGMAVVWGTVKDHNGYIDVQSIEGKGTTFILYFPATREKLSEDKSRLAIESYRGSGESILIVDDVEEQRKIASGMLKELGYSVVSVSSGEEAVEYLKTNKVDLLVLDMIMDPGMDGLDTYKKIIEMNPGQKAIIASGFSETDRVNELQRLGAGVYIKKPFLLEKVGLAVREELKN